MPAASAEKRARQRANKLLRMEAETTVTVSDAQPTAEIISESLLSTPAPTSFTITYSPLSISYPEPIDPAAHLSDVVQVTRDQLADMLHQSYVHGSEHGWKTHFAAANEGLQASYEQDMQDAASAFAEHGKAIQEEAFDRGYEYGIDGCEAQLASLQESLIADHQKQHLSTLADFGERCQESHEAGIQEERDRWKSARASKVNTATQTDPAITSSMISVQTDSPIFSPTMTTTAVQTSPVIISPTSSSTVTISTQTEPLKLNSATISTQTEPTIPT
jgi:hypothetical protein